MKVAKLIEILQGYPADEEVVLYDEKSGRGQTFFKPYEVVTQRDFYGARPIGPYGRDSELPVSVSLFLANTYPGDRHNEGIFLNRDGTRYDEHYDMEKVRTMVQRDPKPWNYTDPVSGKRTRLKFNSEHANLAKWEPRDGFSRNKEDYW